MNGAGAGEAAATTGVVVGIGVATYGDALGTIAVEAALAVAPLAVVTMVGLAAVAGYALATKRGPPDGKWFRTCQIAPASTFRRQLVNFGTFEIVIMTTLVVGFYIVCTRLSELHSRLRNLERTLCGNAVADEAKLAEIEQLAKSGKSGRAVALYRHHFGATLAEAAGAVEKLGDATTGH